MKRPKVLFLGPCWKLNLRTGALYQPFANESRSGRFLRAIISDVGIDLNADVKFDNILSGPALDGNAKEYNPTWRELLAALDGHSVWSFGVRDIIVALSSPVSIALHEAARAMSCSQKSRQATLISMAHPSYVMRRCQLERFEYAHKLKESILQALRLNQSSGKVA